ncbi:hypothetical protein M9H77_06432 [Catharanthus roseus]|uniref:Uncharacterized protein n=1 Tax=Catharanthus roseus TaxID=4058 RepID=A0ACC0BSC7_CATRO|nr:hypothetical protein M9H77_06432 [Catharanthus roseus]
MNKGRSGQIHNTDSKVGEEKSTNHIPRSKKGRIAGHMCNGTFIVREDKMISIIPLKTSLLNLWTVGMEFQVKFILYVTTKFPCSTMKYAYRHCWLPIFCETGKLGQLN